MILQPLYFFILYIYYSYLHTLYHGFCISSVFNLFISSSMWKGNGLQIKFYFLTNQTIELTNKTGQNLSSTNIFTFSDINSLFVSLRGRVSCWIVIWLYFPTIWKVIDHKINICKVILITSLTPLTGVLSSATHLKC